MEISEGANGNTLGPDNVIAHNDVGVLFHQGANGNVVGPGNVIAYNGGAGIEVRNQETLHNTITQNSIHDNGGMGIDLWDGGNIELAAPIIADLDLDAGTVTGTVCSNCTVEILCDSCSEGKVYEGGTTADGAGTARRPLTSASTAASRSE